VLVFLAADQDVKRTVGRLFVHPKHDPLPVAEGGAAARRADGLGAEGGEPLLAFQERVLGYRFSGRASGTA